jgi:hypothetical protein
MAKSLNPIKIESKAGEIVVVWAKNTDFTIKDLTLLQMTTNQTTLKGLITSIKTKEDELTPLRNQRDDLAKILNEQCVRVRAGMKGFFGLNSTQYEQVGGTRSSERKSPKRTPKVTTTKSPTT